MFIKVWSRGGGGVWRGKWGLLVTERGEGGGWEEEIQKRSESGMEASAHKVAKNDGKESIDHSDIRRKGWQFVRKDQGWWILDPEKDKSNVKAEIVSIIPDPSHQTDTPAPPVSTPVIDISSPQLSSHVNAPLLTATTEMTTTILTLPPPPPSQSVTDSGLAARVVELEKRNAELERVFTIQNKTTNNLASRIFTLEHHDLEYRIKNYIRDAVKDFIQAALRAPILQSFQDLTKNAPGSTQPPFKDFEQSTKKKPDSDASVAQQPPAHTSSAWKITDTRDAPSGSLIHMSEPQSEQSCDDTPTPDDTHASDPEDADNSSDQYLKKKDQLHLNQNRWYCGRIGKEELSKANLEDQVDLVNPEGHWIVPNISKPLPLGGPPGDKEWNKALSISKLKAAHYQDFGLEELVPSLWIESDREYDISAAYGITHWWFRRKQFYINKHSEPSDRDAVRSHMRILSVISIKTYERYGYNYLREIVLRRADYKEYKISEKDFKNLHPNDFEDLNILHIQGKLDHLPKQDKVHLRNAVNLWTRNIVIRKRVEDLQLGIESYQTKLNLEQPNWDASDFPFKEDYTIVFKPRAVIYKDRDENRKMMRINEVHKFSDGTLTRIKEKLDFMVKDFKLFKFNKGMENRKWIEDDKRRSEDFIEVDQQNRVTSSYKRSHKGVKASANSDIVYFFTSAQDGDTLQGYERLDLADDLKKAPDHKQ
ncbi:hypothetical protein Tco_0186455 [Tanacetum coccineum]